MLKLSASIQHILMVQLLLMGQFIFSAEHERLNDAAAEVDRSPKKTGKCQKCWKATNVVATLINVSTAALIAGTAIYVGPDIIQAYSMCKNGMDDVNSALPTIKDAITKYPTIYNRTQQIIDDYTNIEPYVRQIPDFVNQVDALETEVNVLDMDVRALINNCTKPHHHKRHNATPNAKNVKDKAKRLKDGFAHWHAQIVLASQTVKPQPIKSRLKNAPRRSYQIDPIKRGKMARAQQNHTKNRR